MLLEQQYSVTKLGEDAQRHEREKEWAEELEALSPRNSTKVDPEKMVHLIDSIRATKLELPKESPGSPDKL